MNHNENQPKTANNAATERVDSTELLAYPETKESDMEGVWTNGSFTIEWIDEDHVKVTKHWREFCEEAVLCGGDFETILESLFVQPVVQRIHY